ncbi:oxidoreductase [Amycolatopsis sp. NBRC 101858]|uniref:Gfo/Idh/MocA family protein n=1 Tax=Amycolatopsis sp. NBRC 101858 TaxID=3032200 RepID=UPI0024A1E37E|nr:Gfo/Idh/MocA family oxidoreductase [Amycolatopsis sp. NBRC 101858]GLY44509.1 oxidoreductase [Amycolatopsis sp. NBRC 101858]
MSLLRVGVLGCASIAWRKMLPALTGHPGVAVVALASRAPEKAARFTARFGGEAVTGYDRLLARGDLDAVYLPLPAALHAEWVERALEAGVHVLAEKPLATTAKDAEHLVALAAERRLALFENFMFRCHSQHAAVREAVATGAIGTVRSLTAEFTIPAPAPGDMRYDPEVGGGALLDIGVYPVRTALDFLGEDGDVAGATLNVDARLGVDVGGSAVLTGPAGRTAHVTFGMRHGYRSRYELTGEQGRITALWAYTPPAGHAPVIRIESGTGIEERTLPPDDQFAAVVRRFVSRVRDGAPSDLEGRAIVAQAGLVDRIRQRAVLLPDPGCQADRASPPAGSGRPGSARPKPTVISNHGSASYAGPPTVRAR